MELTAPTTRIPNTTITYDEPLSLDSPAAEQPTISAFTRRPRKLAKGDVVRVLHGGQIHITTITRINRWEAHTSNYGPWWIGQPGHDWGDGYHANGDYMIG